MTDGQELYSVFTIWVIYRPEPKAPYYRLNRQFVKPRSEDWVSYEVAPFGTVHGLENERTIDNDACEWRGTLEILRSYIPAHFMNMTNYRGGIEDPTIEEVWLE